MRAIAAALFVAPLLLLTSAPAGAAPSETTSVRLLAITDLQGTLEAPVGESSNVTEPNGRRVEAGGVAYLAAYLEQLRHNAPKSLLYSVGDNWGASGVASSLFHDEPTVDVLGHLDLAASGVGNHELDAGAAEFARLRGGGCHPDTGCRYSDTFGGATFPLVASNTTTADGTPVAMPFSVDYVDGIPVGVISALPADTPAALPPGVRDEFRFADELDAIDATARTLDYLGVSAIVLLLHESDDAGSPAPPCDERQGPGHRLAAAASPLIDVVFTGDNAARYDCTVTDPDGNPRVVMNPHSRGQGIAVADLVLDHATGDVVRERTTSFNQTVAHDITPDAEVAAIVDRANEKAADQAARRVGVLAAPMSRRTGPTGESALGNLVADAQLSAARVAGAQLALTNPGGVRADLDGDAEGVVTFADAHAVQPFENDLVVVTLTGEQLKEALEQQIQDRDGQAIERILAPSQGFSYTFEAAARPGDRVSGLALDGEAIALDRDYRVALNRFLADGGDGFRALGSGRDRVQVGTDLAAFVDYLRVNSPVPVPSTERISAPT
ncbi:bifunctional metallophosphatase/5'-nucleotidase [Rhodococcus rhodnii]|uniref:Bifunctional metallophosphatase/5'-nucleotidase n=1 Tax=Rhodococcus rhodnii TaxID=38312 RepID=A0A6P2CC12_9NOCA|nr:bifunctional metallophosphatase/5'-nucleotidase [Rhodococcus rhodnii]